jgi:hypothetical protein
VQCWDGCTVGGVPRVEELAQLFGVERLVEGDSSVCALERGGGVSCVGVQIRVGPFCHYLDFEKAAHRVFESGSTVQLEGGGGRICARSVSGKVLCWGNRVDAPLGDGKALFLAKLVEIDLGSAVLVAVAKM